MTSFPVVKKYLLFFRFKKSKTAIENSGDQTLISKNKAASIKLARTLFIVFVVFAGCWMPYALLVLIDFNDRLVTLFDLFPEMVLRHRNSTGLKVIIKKTRSSELNAT